MAEAREVKVKLSADVADYISGMDAARRATRRLGLTWAGMEAVFRGDGSNGWLIVHHSLDGRECASL